VCGAIIIVNNYYFFSGC